MQETPRQCLHYRLFYARARAAKYSRGCVNYLRHSFSAWMRQRNRHLGLRNMPIKYSSDPLESDFKLDIPSIKHIIGVGDTHTHSPEACGIYSSIMAIRVPRV